MTTKQTAELAPQTESAPAKTRSYGVNHFRILGRMVRDPELRHTQTGKAVLNFGIATNVGGFPEFHDCVAWEKGAEIIAKYGRKGREIQVSGRLTSRTREVGETRVKQIDLVVDDFQLIGDAPAAE